MVTNAVAFLRSAPHHTQSRAQHQRRAPADELSARPSQEHHISADVGHVRSDGARGKINGHWFEDYVAQMLVQELRPGDIVIMDNLYSHKREAVRVRIEAAGSTVRLRSHLGAKWNAASRPAD